MRRLRRGEVRAARRMLTRALVLLHERGMRHEVTRTREALATLAD